MTDNKTKMKGGEILNINSKSDLNSKVLEELKKDPLMVPPSGFTGIIKDSYIGDTCKLVEDRLNVKLEQFVPNMDDLFEMVPSLCDCIPIVGSMMEGILTMMFTKMKGEQREEIVTKDTIKNQVDIEIAKVKNEIIQTIENKVEKSNIETKKKLCETAFEGIKESHLESLQESLTHLKLRLLDGKKPEKKDPLLVEIRLKFDDLRKKLKELLSICLDQSVILHLSKISIQIMAMYTLILQDLINHWYKYGYDPEYSLGTPADDEEPETESFRDKLHLKIQTFIKTMQVNNDQHLKLLKKLKKELETDFGLKKKQNEEYSKLLQIDWSLKGIDKIFESDPILYPIPLIKIQDIEKPKEYRAQTIKITTSKVKGPCIYRIDANGLFDPYNISEISKNEKKKPWNVKETDFMTNCEGLTGQIGNICLEFDEKKYVRFRWFVNTSFYNENYLDYNICLDDEYLTNKDEFQKSKNFEEVGGIHSFDDLSIKQYFNETYDKFGFFTSEKIKEKKDIIFLSSNLKSLHKLYFIEVIVSDE